MQTQHTLDFTDRKRTSRLQNEILAALRSGPKLSTELVVLSHRFGARIMDLRKSGHEIETANIGKGVFRYTLK